MSCGGLIVITKLGKVILVRGKNGKYSFPKGKFESNKDLNMYECAVREFLEEAGLINFTYRFSSEPIIEYTDTGSVSCKYYVCVIEDELSGYGIPADHTDIDGDILSVEYFNVDELMRLPSYQFYTRRRNIGISILESYSSGTLNLDDEDLMISLHKRTKISKAMSKWLRHHLDKFSTTDREGFVNIDELISKLRSDSRTDFTVDRKSIECASRHCFKQRTQIKDDKIRCVQGHSSGDIDDDLAMELITVPIPNCVHATDAKLIVSILSRGLNKMSRHHIHFSDNPNLLRKGNKVHIEVKMKEAMDDGIQFYKAANGVILSPGNNGVIPAKYLIVHNQKTSKKYGTNR